MGIKEAVRNWLGVPAVKAVPLSSLRNWNMLAGTPSTTVSITDSPEGWIQAVDGNVWAGNCVHARCSVIAQAPLKLYQYTGTEDDREEITDHEVLTLLETINPFTNQITFRRQIESQLSIFGDCIVVKVRGLRSAPNELLLLPRQLCDVQADAGGWGPVVTWTPQGKIIASEDLIRFRYPAHDGSVMGSSPTRTALKYVNAYNTADASAEAIDKRGGQGGGIVSFDALLNGIDLERMRADWERRYTDPKNAGVDKFMPPGTKYESGALTGQQMQREERMGRLAKSIMGCYQVPPAVAGDYSDASVLANAAVQSRAMWDFFALDELRFIEETLNNDLLWREWPETKDAGFYLEHDLDDIAALQEDSDKRMNRAVVGVNGGIISINEGREIVELEPVNDPNADAVSMILEQQAKDEQAKQKAAELEVLKEQQPQQFGQQQPGAPMQPQPPQPGQVPQQFAGRAESPIFDFVGMQAIAPDGTTGTIEAIKRFGEVAGMTATKAEPIVVIDGRAYRASECKAVIDGG